MALLFAHLLAWIALKRWPARVLGNRLVAQSVYMIRHYLLGGPDHLRPKALFRLYVNNFRRSDDDSALHNHPWPWALAIPLVNGYWEERLTLGGIIRRRVLPWRPWAPWRVNFLRGSTFHRVELTQDATGQEQEAWSLFIVPGQSTQEWGFLDRATFRFRPFRRGAGTAAT